MCLHLHLTQDYRLVQETVFAVYLNKHTSVFTTDSSQFSSKNWFKIWSKAWWRDVPLHGACVHDGPGSTLPGQHCVPTAFPPVVVSSFDVQPSTESPGLPPQRLCQEKSLPVSVRPLPVKHFCSRLYSIPTQFPSTVCICISDRVLTTSPLQTACLGVQ